MTMYIMLDIETWGKKPGCEAYKRLGLQPDEHDTIDIP